MGKKLFFFTLMVVIALMAVQSCATHYFRSNYKDVNSLMHATAESGSKLFLKVHLKNGDVCILRDSWEVDTLLNALRGDALRYNFNRVETYKGFLSISIDSIAILETNQKLTKTEDGRIVSLALIAGLDVAMGLYCLVNPKACFGSCPTFYINENEYLHYADAEGFSSAVSPSMEYYDIDALNNEALTDGFFSITMKNEALETHCVNELKLLAYPRERGERVYHSPDNQFYRCENLYPLTSAQGNEGDITTRLKYADKQERFSLSSIHSLHSPEEIFLDFLHIPKPEDLGLILSFRQTLMTTYLFYNAIGYMGDEVSDIFALLETDSNHLNGFDASTRLMGGIRVWLWNEQEQIWEFQNEFYEAGPIALNTQFIPLKNLPSASGLRLKLELNKGLWRIDYAALTNIKEKGRPLEVLPTAAMNKGKVDRKALAQIKNPGEYLISMPGDAYNFSFQLPAEHRDYELFLYSKGYYLEWIRNHWQKEKDLRKLKQMVDHPEKYLRNEARRYKQYELKMEEVFWSSRIDTETFQYDEN